MIGEAVKHLPPDLIDTRPEVAWQSSSRMRDRLGHGFFHVSTAIVWETIEKDLHRAPGRGLVHVRGRRVGVIGRPAPGA